MIRLELEVQRRLLRLSCPFQPSPLVLLCPCHNSIFHFPTLFLLTQVTTSLHPRVSSIPEVSITCEPSVCLFQPFTCHTPVLGAADSPAQREAGPGDPTVVPSKMTLPEVQSHDCCKSCTGAAQSDPQSWVFLTCVNFDSHGVLGSLLDSDFCAGVQHLLSPHHGHRLRPRSAHLPSWQSENPTIL